MVSRNRDWSQVRPAQRSGLLDPNDVARNETRRRLAEPEGAQADDFKPILSGFHPVHSFQVQFQCLAAA
jgi:hypothetical protein